MIAARAVLPVLAPTVHDLFTTYAREYLPQKAPKTCYMQGRLLLRMAEEFGPLPLEALTPPYLRAWRDGLLARYKPGTVRGYIQTLSGALRVAVEDYDWLESNPLTKVKKPAPAKTRVRFLSDEERGRLLAACQVSRSPALTTIVLVALATGARKMEILSLHWGQVDSVRRLLQLPDTKSGQGRAVPMPPRVVEALEHWGETRRLNVPWVFPSVTGQQPMSISSAWEHAVQRAELPNFRFHDLRHTAASWLAMSGASVREIAEILGHTSLAMAFRYVHMSQSHMSAVIDRMADKYLS